MSTPATLQILNGAEAALRLIDVGSGYNYTILDDSIHLGQRSNIERIAEFPSLDVFEAADLETDYDAANGTVVYTMTWAVEGFLEPGDEASRSAEQQQLIEDIIEAIQLDHRLGLPAIVISTRLVAAQTDDGLELADRWPRRVGTVWETEFERTHGSF